MPGIYSKVSELRFIKIKERQVNKFNKLIKRKGNIIWFNAVPSAGNPLANDYSGATLMPRQPVLLPFLPQLGHRHPKQMLIPQAISASPPASPVRSQALQAENADTQAVSTAPPGSAQVPQAGTDIQAIGTPSPAFPSTPGREMLMPGQSGHLPWQCTGRHSYPGNQHSSPCSPNQVPVTPGKH